VVEVIESSVDSFNPFLIDGSHLGSDLCPSSEDLKVEPSPAER
jgi:hypothetical protein